jgi:hypothetical protein
VADYRLGSPGFEISHFDFRRAENALNVINEPVTSTAETIDRQNLPTLTRKYQDVGLSESD